MRFAAPLTPARLVRRYKRFLADVELPDGTLATAHCPNPGAMLGLADPGADIRLSRAGNPKRKLPWTWETVRLPDAWAGIDTTLPNRLVAEALAGDLLEPFRGYDSVRPEVKYGQASRVDFLLEGPDRPPCYLEVKNCHLMRQRGLAEFPDCVAARSARHVRELAAMRDAGARAVLLFVVQYTGSEAMTLAADIDPAFAAAVREGRARGLDVLCYACHIDEVEIRLDRPIPFVFV